MDAADSAMGDNFHQHYCLDYLEAQEPSMLYGWGHDGSSRVSGGYHDSRSPDAVHSSSPVASAVAAGSRNVVVFTGRVRGRRLNDKLYALRSVVPNITKMDKTSIIKDAIEYVQKLQEQERQLLAELEPAAPATRGKQRGAPDVGIPPDVCVPPMKRMRRFMSSSSTATSASAMTATSRRLEALEVRVTGAGDEVLLVSVACLHRKDAMAKVCLALDNLRLAIISANIMSTLGTLKYTALVQKGEIRPSEMKQLIETAIAQVDAAGSTLGSMSY